MGLTDNNEATQGNDLQTDGTRNLFNGFNCCPTCGNFAKVQVLWYNQSVDGCAGCSRPVDKCLCRLDPSEQPTT